MTKIINCTPHAIIVRTHGKDITFAPSGVMSRVSTIETPADEFFCERTSFECVTQKTGTVEGLPAPEFDTVFIVSGMVFSATDRKDVIAPDTGKTAIRENGQVVAVTRFIVK